MHDGEEKRSPNATPGSRPLDYATQIGEYPEPHVHAAAALILIGIAALAGVGSILEGLCYAIDFRLDAALLLAGGGARCWATLGHLSANHLNFRRALLLQTIGLVCLGIVIVLAHRDLRVQEALFGKLDFTSTDGGTVVYHAEVIRNCAVAWEAIGAILWLYVVIQIAGKRNRRLHPLN